MDGLARHHRLSPVRAELVGREQELAVLHALLHRPKTRLLTLTGTGGSGKTQLALRLAADLDRTYARHSWVVELAEVSDSDLVPVAVATAAGLVGARSESSLDWFVDFLTATPALLVLDNCEHVVDACAALVDVLLRNCPELRIIATSREALMIPGEQQYQVPPLAVPDLAAHPSLGDIAVSPAVELFVRRAQAVLPSFELTPSNANTVVGICTRLEGIPLALELAAARVRVLSVGQILSRLDDAFRLLTGGSRLAPARHQTMVSSLDWSYGLLDDSERAVFRRLAVFSGRFTLDAVDAVIAPANVVGWDALAAVTGLVDKSLLLVDRLVDTTACYRLLEPIRQYAAAHLRAEAEAEEIHARHARYYLDLTQRMTSYGSDQERWFNSLDQDQGDLRLALRWALEHGGAGDGLRAAVALVPYWEARGRLSEGRRWLDAVVTNAAGAPPALRARGLTGAGHLAYLQGEYDTAETLLRYALAAAHQSGNPADSAGPLTELGAALRLRRNLAESERCLLEGLAFSREIDDRAGIAYALMHLGATVGMRGDVTYSVSLLEESLTIWEALGDWRHVVFVWSALGINAVQEGDPATAADYLTRSLAEHRRMGDRWRLISDLLGLAWVLLVREKPLDAGRLLGAAEAHGEGPEDPMPRIKSDTYTSLVETVRPLHHQPAFSVAWVEGRAMSLDEAAEYALSAIAALGLTARFGDSGSLTRRELEVARLVAAGHTDRQIAETLFLSPRTVGVHLHHILRKLGLRSRAELAAWLEGNQSKDVSAPSTSV